MDNHVHFVVEPQNLKGLARLFCALNTKYVRYFHKKYGEFGRMFGDRYFSTCLDEEHFYEAIRYVELNPFAANLESKPGDYYWSSAGERLQKRSEYYLHRLPMYFKVSNWWSYLTEKIDLHEVWDVIRKSTTNGKPLGNDQFFDFLKKVLKKKDSKQHDLNSKLTI